jgi:hypothetical protein
MYTFETVFLEIKTNIIQQCTFSTIVNVNHVIVLYTVLNCSGILCKIGGETREKGRGAIDLSTGGHISLVLLGRGWRG